MTIAAADYGQAQKWRISAKNTCGPPRKVCRQFPMRESATKVAISIRKIGTK
jgi:hypothetical protein